MAEGAEVGKVGWTRRDWMEFFVAITGSLLIWGLLKLAVPSSGFEALMMGIGTTRLLIEKSKPTASSNGALIGWSMLGVGTTVFLIKVIASAGVR